MSDLDIIINENIKKIVNNLSNDSLYEVLLKFKISDEDDKIKEILIFDNRENSLQIKDETLFNLLKNLFSKLSNTCKIIKKEDNKYLRLDMNFNEESSLSKELLKEITENEFLELKDKYIPEEYKEIYKNGCMLMFDSLEDGYFKDKLKDKYGYMEYLNNLIREKYGKIENLKIRINYAFSLYHFVDDEKTYEIN